ncbi:D-amino-acid dehydrogenase [Andreprevotia lacus DSM 23236]|jgi:D-amino-acid dehydrogenase|uniref:D-amino acid dehydrogenase n=2 Tax=Andreprevotia TaxID=397275 RepID=A0A1W1XCW1_9NEIS|nr:D-amino acid dehydrogenase [Andreprevotia lacus]SMC21756.1 D-amino-acid dehydrogenase [Andreprevotia lacus DSM 23236]
MRVIVLGAGVIGVTSAWFLNQAGHDVTVIERAPEAARETSYANGGQISVCHAEPWANPKAPWRVLQWLGEEDAPLLFRLRADPALWRWGWQFLRQCTPARARANLQHLVRLGLYSRSELQALRAATGIQYDERREGILHFYTDEADFAAAIPAAALMRDTGLDREVKTAAECLAIEPALARSHRRIVGGTYTPSDESGDARQFTNALVQRCEQHGVRFRYDCRIDGLQDEGGRISAVQVHGERGAELLRADAFLVCLGSYSALQLRPLGIRLDLYPAKGYSATIPLRGGDIAPTVSLTDDGQKLVFSRLGERLRVAGTAEFNGYNLDLNPVRCRALLERTRSIFPDIAGYDEAEFWTGLRPATPGNLPYIGRTRYANLYLNTGHGTLGWTECCGSGHAIADLMSGRQPAVEFPFIDGI